MREADYNSNNRSHGSEFMLGVLCGAAVGAAVGLLLAPRAGSELRGQIADSAERIGRKAADTYSRASEAMNDIVSRGRDAAERGRDKFEEVRSNFSRAEMES